MTRLLRPLLSCPACGAPLEFTGATMSASPAAGAEQWRVDVQLQTIECGAGHVYVAEYEQREPWRSVLVGFGDRVDQAA